MSQRRKVLAAIGAAVTGAALMAVPASAAAPENAGLQAHGPIAEHGYPAWYQDKTGLRLEPCLDTGDADMCGLVADGFTGTASMPDHFPDEFFYTAGMGALTVGAVDVSVEAALEGAWAAETVRDGDQIVFGRIRIRASGLQAGETYRVIHPYGEDVFEATADDRNINFTEDLGVAANNFAGALGSRIGPFLRWDSGAPEGYIGDPNVEHTFTGSPYDTNYFQLIGPGVANGAPSANLCNPLPAGVAQTDCIQQAQWSIMGKKATNADVKPEKAVYTPSNDGTPGGTITVYASSDENETIVVDNGAAGDADFVARRQLYGSHGQYIANVSYSGATPPATLTVRNLSDTPIATRTVKVTDNVTVANATWVVNANGRAVLAVRAASTDPSAVLTVHGPANTMAPVTNGLGRILDLQAPPVTVTVRSDKGGVVTAPVKANVAPTAVLPPTAVPTHPGNVQPGAVVYLDGSESAGMGQLSYNWSQVNADGTPFTADAGQPALTIGRRLQANPQFRAPETPGTLHLALAVTDQTGLTSTTKFEVVVDAPAAPLAVAINRLDAMVGSTVTLDASGSLNPVRYRWQQLQPGANPVELTDFNRAKATFTMPAVSSPSLPLRFRLTVTGGDGTTSTTEVLVFQVIDSLAITRGSFRSPDLRVEGTSSVTRSNAVTLTVTNVVTGASGRLDPVPVDAAGDWGYRGPLPAGVTGDVPNLRITAVSKAGAQVLNFTATR